MYDRENEVFVEDVVTALDGGPEVFTQVLQAFCRRSLRCSPDVLSLHRDWVRGALRDLLVEEGGHEEELAAIDALEWE